MIRTQIYITAQENGMLALLARLEGRTKSEVIRGILDEKLGPGATSAAAMAARRTLGAWEGLARRGYLRRIRSRW